MTLEDRLREQLKAEATQVDVSPDAWLRLRRRMRPRRVTPGRLVLVLGTAAVVAVGVWVISSQRTVKQGLTNPPPQHTYFDGYWPVKTAREAYDIQQRVDAGEEQWRKDPGQVARGYIKTLGWTDSSAAGDATVVSGSSSEGWSASVGIAPKIGEGTNATRGPLHTVLLVGLSGTDNPAWFVAGITDNNITVDTPRLADAIHSPLHVSGKALTFEGNVLVTVVDDAGHKLGQAPFIGGGSEKMPFDGYVPFSMPGSDDGIVQFEGSNGAGGPSTDVTVVRVAFANGEASPVPTPPNVSNPPPSGPDEAFHCLVEARKMRELDSAKSCMTSRFYATQKPDVFMGASSPWLVRGTIQNVGGTPDRKIYDGNFYWATSAVASHGKGAIEFLSADTVTIVHQNGGWLVDDWNESQLSSVGTTARVALTYLLPGDTPKCDANGPTPDSFTTVTREIPNDGDTNLVLEIVNETLSGAWRDEGDAVQPLPEGTRVKSVDITGNDVRITLTDTDYRPSAACDFAVAALQRTIRTLPGHADANVTFSTP